jgi:hypothetical protein
MKLTSKTYLEIVNDAIDESGEDLTLFSSDGSDFISNTDAMMNRFKKWVAQAWRDLQQESMDWEWMSEQAIVNITPGIMFYSSSPITWAPDYVNPVTIIDVDGTNIISGLEASKVVNLTGLYTGLQNFGYINTLYSDYTITNQHALDFGLKAGGEYFLSSVSANFRISTTRDLANFQPGIVVTTATIKTYDSSNVLLTTVAYPVVDGIIDNVNFVTPTINELLVTTSNLDNTFWNDLYNKMKFAFRTSVTLTNSDTVSLEFNVSDVDSLNDSAISPEGYTATYSEMRLNPGGVTVIGTGGGPVVGPVTAYPSATMNITIINDTIDGIIEDVQSVHIDANIVVEYASDSTVAKFTVTGDSTACDNRGSLPIYLFNATFQHQLTDNLTWWMESFVVGAPATAIITCAKFQPNGGLSFAAEAIITDPVATKNYVHSWKSFDWSEELDDDDFVENVREVNQSTFRIVSHENPAVASETKMEFLPWDEFQNRYDFASSPPARPRLVTEDNTGRWRFYPNPDRPYTILFNYVREPQKLIGFSDVPKGLAEEYEDLIKWKALQYYGLYDEQPSISNVNRTGRADLMYRSLLMKFEMQTRPKFHFLPKRLY